MVASYRYHTRLDKAFETVRKDFPCSSIDKQKEKSRKTLGQAFSPIMLLLEYLPLPWFTLIVSAAAHCSLKGESKEAGVEKSLAMITCKDDCKSLLGSLAEDVWVSFL